jgi:hypothetical protein
LTCIADACSARARLLAAGACISIRPIPLGAAK